jgi:hypothetical protein
VSESNFVTANNERLVLSINKWQYIVTPRMYNETPIIYDERKYGVMKPYYKYIYLPTTSQQSIQGERRER